MATVTPGLVLHTHGVLQGSTLSQTPHINSAEPEITVPVSLHEHYLLLCGSGQLEQLQPGVQPRASLKYAPEVTQKPWSWQFPLNYIAGENVEMNCFQNTVKEVTSQTSTFAPVLLFFFSPFFAKKSISIKQMLISGNASKCTKTRTSIPDLQWHLKVPEPYLACFSLRKLLEKEKM